MNSFGTLLRVSIAGESHGPVTSIMVDGVPPGIELSPEDMRRDLQRRKAVKRGTTQRLETDIPEILSGVFRGYTTGSPILIIFHNRDIRSQDYEGVNQHPRPGHADFTGQQKFKGFNDYRGGGHFSGRLTTGLVAAGVIAKKVVAPIEIEAKLLEAGGSKDIEGSVEKALRKGDSIGGIVECTVKSPPVSLGEPFFDSVESRISHGIFSIPGIKGIEFGAGFESSKMYGSEHNDLFITKDGKTDTNNAGGINGGITNANDIVFRIAVKPTSSISILQNSLNFTTGKSASLLIPGRHDCCFALRVPPIVEAVTALVLGDLQAIQKRNRDI